MAETTPQLPKSDQNLIWLDCEMTGLEPDVERIIEIAVIVTGPNLEPRVEGPVLVIHQSNEQLDKMDAWNKGTHGKSGLVEKVKASTLDEDAAQEQLIAFLSQYVPKGGSPMCGNSIGQDRRFLVKYMPKLEAFFTTAIWTSARSRNCPSVGGRRYIARSRSSKATRRWPMFMSPSTS